MSTIFLKYNIDGVCVPKLQLYYIIETNNPLHMPKVKVRDKVMNYIALSCYGHGYYPHFLEYLHFVDIIRIFHITSYLDRNIHHVLHTYLVMPILSFTFTHLV